MKQLRQSKFKKGTTEYENISSPNGEVKAFKVNSVSGNLEYTTDYTNFSEVGGGQECLVGTTDPTTATVGEVGQFYLNITTNKLFQCQSAGGGSYTWGVPNVNAVTLGTETQTFSGSKNLIVPANSNIQLRYGNGTCGIKFDTANQKIRLGELISSTSNYAVYGKNQVNGRYAGNNFTHYLPTNKSGTLALTSDIPTLDSTPTQNSQNAVTSGGVYQAIQSFVPNGINYLTTAPVADNTDGDLKIVVLSSEPATKYNGYLYIWEN